MEKIDGDAKEYIGYHFCQKSKIERSQRDCNYFTKWYFSSLRDME